MNKVKNFVVVNTSTDLIRVLGVFQTAEYAYSCAYLYLSELATVDCDYAEEKFYITPLNELNCETGYGMALVDASGKEQEQVYILFDEEYEDIYPRNSKGGDAI